MQKDVFRACLLVLPLLCAPTLGYGQNAAHRPLVAVAPFQNATGEDTYASFSRTVAATIELTLKLLGGYDLSPVTSFDPSGGERAAAALAASRNLDSVIYGTILMDKGACTIRAMVYDRGAKAVTVTREERVQSVLDVFDASDRITVSLVEAFSGRRIVFGSIQLVNTGEVGAFTATVDGIPVAPEGAVIRSVLGGKHRVEIRQERMLGQALLAGRDLVVDANDVAELSFAIPYLTEEESRYVEESRRAVTDGWNDPARAEEVARLLDSVAGRLEETAYCPRLGAIRDEFTELRAKFTDEVATRERAAEKQGAMVRTGKTRKFLGITTVKTYTLGEKQYSNRFGSVPIVKAMLVTPGISEELNKDLTGYRKVHAWDGWFVLGGFATMVGGATLFFYGVSEDDSDVASVGVLTLLLGVGLDSYGVRRMIIDPPLLLIQRYNDEMSR